MMIRFSVRNTNICKGAACLLLLFHHLFYHQSRWDSFYHIFGISPPLISIPAVMAKVCVTIFIILSGYGLTRSAEKYGKADWRFVYKHILKLMLQYWFVFVIFVPMGFAFGRSPIGVYGTGIKGIIKLLIDFMGLANIFNTPTMNETWWFMGAIILLYLLFPLLRRAMLKLPYVILAAAALLCFYRFTGRYYSAFFAWIFPFAAGIYLADKRIPDAVMHTKYRIAAGIASFLFCLLCAFLRKKFDLSVKIDTFFGLGIIIFSATVLDSVKFISRALLFIGVHSANIFMMHTFIYSKYFSRQIYSLWYPILIYAALLGICLLISMGIEALKRLTRYNKLQSLLLNIGGNKS